MQTTQLTKEQRQAIDERVTIDLVLGNTYKDKGVFLPNIQFKYIIKVGLEVLGEPDIWTNNPKAYKYIRSLIWETSYGNS